MRTLSVVIPALDEREPIAATPASTQVDALRFAGLDVEILLVDNGSTDGTGRVARQRCAGDVDLTHRLDVQPYAVAKPCGELPVTYRPRGGQTKLRPTRDGLGYVGHRPRSRRRPGGPIGPRTLDTRKRGVRGKPASASAHAGSADVDPPEPAACCPAAEHVG